MVVCGEGGDVFMVPTQRPKWPTHKDHRKKKKKKKKSNKGILVMVLNNGVVRGSHGCACGVDTWFPWMAYERPMDDALMK